ncbi:MAG TPA: 7-cyano-7-deazaguanine synthase QueC [Acidimicrobiales bacterium]
MDTRRVVAIVSGGMDSVTLAYHLHDGGYELHLVSFDYGQRHRRELTMAVRAALALDVEHSIVELPITGLIPTSALTSDTDVPEGHYAEDNMRITVVPNRNMTMLSVAGAIAVAEEAVFVATANHAGDHFIYPDCRPEFIQACSAALMVGNIGFSAPGFEGIKAPFINISKASIVEIGHGLHVPWADTWSCYQGNEVHCGRCGTCVERAEAFSLAKVEDPTTYADPDFWRGAVADYAAR